MILTAIFAGFLIIAAFTAAAAAVSLFARRAPLSGMWDSKETLYQLLRHRFVFGPDSSCSGRVVLRRGRLITAAVGGSSASPSSGQFASQPDAGAAARDLASSWVIAVDAIVLVGSCQAGQEAVRDKRHRTAPTRRRLAGATNSTNPTNYSSASTPPPATAPRQRAATGEQTTPPPSAKPPQPTAQHLRYPHQKTTLQQHNPLHQLSTNPTKPLTKHRTTRPNLKQPTTPTTTPTTQNNTSCRLIDQPARWPPASGPGEAHWMANRVSV